MGDGAGPVFNERSTRVLLHEACSRIGVTADGAELLRLGENAIYSLHDAPVVVRISRGADRWADAEKEVAVAAWLAESGVPAAEVWPVDQPVDVDGHPVTFWRHIVGHRGGPGDVRALGAVLRQVHGLARPSTLDLPDEQILERVQGRIEVAPIGEADRSFLLSLLAELGQQIGRLDFPLSPCVTHGDAHVQNLMVTAAGVQLIDFERVAWGQPEWDLSMTATEFVSAGFWTPAQYADFIDSYGFDVTEWSGFEVARRTHEIKMTTWLMQNVNESADIRYEYEVRMESIRTGEAGRSWVPF